MKKMGCIHTVEYSALKRMKLCHLQIATRVSPGTVTVLLSEVSQTRRKISHEPLTCGIEKNGTSELIKQRLTDLENELMLASEEEES